MPRPMQRSRPANRPGQTRGGRRGQLEAFERRAEAANATAARAAEAGPIELPAVVSVADLAGILGVPVTQVVATDLGFEVREQNTASPVAAQAVAVAPAPVGNGVAEVVAPSVPAEEPED